MRRPAFFQNRCCVWISLRPHKGLCVEDVVVTLRGFDDLFMRTLMSSYQMGLEQAGLAGGEGEGR